MGSIAEPDQSSLQAALSQAHELYTQRHSASRKNYEEACNYMPGGNTRTVLFANPFPLTIDSGDACNLTTIDGTRYVDFLGEYTAAIYGHNHPEIKAALQRAIEGGWNYGGHNKLEPQLARLVCERFPAIDLVRFVNSGTEANMMAIATALAVTGKKKVLVFNKGYHGSTISGRVQSGKPTINLPHDFVLGTYNDVQGTQALLHSLPKDSLAAILVEPMMGSGGCFAGTAEFLATLRSLADESKALLIFDEVMTSRLDYHGLGHKMSVTPDLMTLGKWIGGGMSFGAFGGKREIMQLYDPRTGSLEHPGTFNNNVFTMSAGVAGCTLLTPDRLQALNALGDSLRQQVEAVLSKRGIEGTLPITPVIDETKLPELPKMFMKGVGSLNAIHFAGPDKDVLQGLYFHHMLESGIYMAQRGFTALNIMLTEEHVAQFVQATEAFCDEFASFLR
ncbi:putative acetylornithine aminotransferase [Exophiala viscosa]|uniref:putative acetylornithine aminotransferase n=1 Tax=Exophiala viscosa TaxID=2486360 RepID=UPI0021A1DEA8|nr:putative acetylornithine aminotransferase [Exophiala viscosa]